MTPDDPLRRALLFALGPRPSPAKRRSLAAVLRQLATEQEQIAEAESRQQARPAAERVTTRKPKAGPGRAPSRFVRIERQAPYGSGRTLERLIVYVGRGLYYEAGSPKRLDVQSLDGRLILSVAEGDRGYAVRAGKGMPRFFADGSRDLLEGMDDGRYAATVVGGRIVVSERLEE